MPERDFLDHRLETQSILREFCLSYETPPGKLPKINEIIFPKRRLKLGRNLSIVGLNGSPNAGKTTALEQRKRWMQKNWKDENFLNLNPPLYHLGRYAHKYKEYLQKESPQIPYSSFEQHMLQLFLLKSEYLEYCEIPENISMKAPVLAERNELDIIAFSRANCLYGHLRRSSQMVVENYAEEIMQPNWPYKRSFYKAYIFCLVPPKTSLDRDEKGETPFRSVLTREFLDLLYEQYLLIHCYALAGEIPHPCVCLDFTNKPEENYQLLINTLGRLHDYFSNH